MSNLGIGMPRVLVVDDDERIAASVRRALVYEGYSVSLAGDGHAALEMLRAAFATEDAPSAAPGDDATTPLEWLAARAWQAGLLVRHRNDRLSQ